MRRGTRVGQAYVAVTADGDGINEEIVNSVDEAGPGVERAGDEHGRRYGERFSDRFRERFDSIREKVSERFNSQMGTAGDESGRNFTRNFEDHFDSDFLDRLGDRVGTGMVSSLTRALGREDGDNPLADLFDRWMDDAVSGNGRGRRGGRGNDAIGAMVGRMFGAGSRNNFLNILGKSIGGVTTGFEKLFTMLSKTSLVTKMTEGISELANKSALLQKIMGGGGQAGGMFSKIAASGPGAVIAIAAVIAALSVMVSVVGAVIGIVTALAATIASALTGALLVLGGAIMSVVAAGGLLTAAFMSMTDAQQSLLADAFAPLKAEMVGIGQIMLQDMVPAFSTWSANLQAALLQAVPVAQVMGKAFADAGNILTRSFSGPGFQMFAQSLATYLPSIITRLSSALGSFLNGMLGLFTALMPSVNRFAGYLALVAAKFATWATSAQGQNAIADFVDRALTSLSTLWDFVTSFSAFIFKVLFSPEAQNAGNTIFTSMARTFDGFIDKVAQAQADGSLQRWFDDAIKFGGQLWGVIEALGGTFMSLYNSGVLGGVGDGLQLLATVIGWINSAIGPMVSVFGGALPGAMNIALGSVQTIASAIIAVGESVEWVLGLVGQGNGAEWGNIKSPWEGGGTGPQTVVPGTMLMAKTKIPKMPSLADLLKRGTTALNATSVDDGGYKPKKQWKNPYTKWANSLIKEGPSVSAQIKNAMLTLNKAVAAGLRSASQSTDTSGVQSSMDGLMESIKTTAEQTVNTARSALNSAAQSLASASTKGAARNALRKVKAAQRDMAAALANQRRINTAANSLATQKIVREWNVNALLTGVFRANTTLAEYAEARSRVAKSLDEANQQLQAAVEMRDTYRNQVAESIKSFGSMLSAQASSINGIEQALTAGDITANLQTRLDKIKKFQTDLRLLLAQGLSNDAYKQIVDAGVEQGSTFADALLGGGTGSIQNVNSLVSQINGIADSLGGETSSRMYQAGVDAAKGLVDGLTSLSAQLDAAAYRLGGSIATAVRKSLGIASPSRVLRAMMSDVGDGAALGLDDQHVKVGSAAARLAAKVAIRPGDTYASTAAAAAGVSGNGDQRFRDLIVHTPTEDPQAVAMEVLNEVTGRL